MLTFIILSSSRQPAPHMGHGPFFSSLPFSSHFSLPSLPGDLAIGKRAYPGVIYNIPVLEKNNYKYGDYTTIIQTTSLTVMLINSKTWTKMIFSKNTHFLNWTQPENWNLWIITWEIKSIIKGKSQKKKVYISIFSKVNIFSFKEQTISNAI